MKTRHQKSTIPWTPFTLSTQYNHLQNIMLKLKQQFVVMRIRENL